MTKGGYQILDLSPYKFTASSNMVNVEGIFNTLYSSKKQILVSGLTYDGVTLRDSFAWCNQYPDGTEIDLIVPLGWDITFGIEIYSDNSIIIYDYR